MHLQGPSRKGLWLIAFFKLLKGLALLALGIGALKLLHRDVAAIAEHWINVFHVDPDNRYVHRLLAKLALVDEHKLRAISVGTFIYSGLLLTEGVGLMMEKRWAEFLTIIATSLFIPIEIYEMARHFTWIRLLVFVINVTIVAYLVKVVRDK